MKKLTAKETYKRLLFKEQMEKKVKTAKAAIKRAETKLAELRLSCPHYHSEYRNRGSGDGWDYEASYWREYVCDDCGDRWTTDQSPEMDKKYPYAVDKTYDR